MVSAAGRSLGSGHWPPSSVGSEAPRKGGEREHTFRRAAERRSRSLGIGFAQEMNPSLLSMGLRGWDWDLAVCSVQQVMSSLS